MLKIVGDSLLGRSPLAARAAAAFGITAATALLAPFPWARRSHTIIATRRLFAACAAGVLFRNGGFTLRLRRRRWIFLTGGLGRGKYAAHCRDDLLKHRKWPRFVDSPPIANLFAREIPQTKTGHPLGRPGKNGALHLSPSRLTSGQRAARQIKRSATLRSDDTRLDAVADEAGNVVHVELLHRIGAVLLNRADAQVKLPSDLL